MSKPTEMYYEGDQGRVHVGTVYNLNDPELEGRWSIIGTGYEIGAVPMKSGTICLFLKDKRIDRLTSVHIAKEEVAQGLRDLASEIESWA